VFKIRSGGSSKEKTCQPPIWLLRIPVLPFAEDDSYPSSFSFSWIELLSGLENVALP